MNEHTSRMRERHVTITNRSFPVGRTINIFDANKMKMSKELDIFWKVIKCHEIGVCQQFCGHLWYFFLYRESLSSSHVRFIT